MEFNSRMRTDSKCVENGFEKTLLGFIKALKDFLMLLHPVMSCAPSTYSKFLKE